MAVLLLAIILEGRPADQLILILLTTTQMILDLNDFAHLRLIQTGSINLLLTNQY